MSCLPKIQALLRAMDDDALAALANRGLLRRAKKDIETITPEILEETETYVRLRVDDCDVTIPEVPAEARSTSPAGNIDRYVLMAFLWLRNRAETADAPKPAIRPEMLDDAALAAWAGKAAFRKVEKLLDGHCRCVVESENPLLIRVPARNIVCRWIEGGNLDTMIVTGPGKNPKEDALLALMLYQIEKGFRSFTLQSIEILETSDGAPRNRLEVLSSLGYLLHEIVFLGLTRLSEATRQRLQSLAVSAHGVDLPRLERMIQNLADEIHLQLSRNAQASTSRILVQVVRLDALRRALTQRLQNNEILPGQTPLGDLVGEHRSRYHSVGSIDLIGMGARQWRTKSAYVGLTVYFLDESTKSWATWSESRPVTTSDFKPASIFHGEGPWNGCPSPAFASRNILKLVDAYRNDNGRLSTRKQTQAIPLQIDDTDAMILPLPVTEWEIVHRQAKRLFHGGLSRRDERDEIVFLKAEHWNDAVFDPADQTLCRTLLDKKGQPLPLLLSYATDFGRPEAIQHLEHYDPENDRGVLGLIRSHQGQIVIEPISFFGPGGIQSPTLENGNTPATTVQPQKTPVPDVASEEKQPEELEWVDLPSEYNTANNGIGLLLETVLSELEMIAESGLYGSTWIRKNSQLNQQAKQLETIGLDIVSKSLCVFLGIFATNQRISQDVEKLKSDLTSSFLHVCYVVYLLLQHTRHPA